MSQRTSVSNVVLITVDSLRADALGSYDSNRCTPIIDSLADDGAVFDRAFATGNWTPFSFPAILASRPVFLDSPTIGVQATPTLASVLSEAGVSTAGFNASNGFLTSRWGYNAGFDEFDPFVTGIGSGLYSRYLATHPTVEAWLQLAASPVRRLYAWARGESDDRPFLDTARMFDVEHAAVSYLDRASSPIFLWVHYMDPHTPYVPAPRYIREVSSNILGTHRMFLAHMRTGLGWSVGERTLSDLRTLYQAAVRQVDASIGRLLETIADREDAETAVVLVGDHGEEFQEHGHLAHYPKLYDELIRVPLIIDVPGASARRIGRQVGLDAIPPTVTDLLGVEAPPEWRGQSLAPSVLDGASPDDRPVVSVTVRGGDVTAQPIPRSLADGDLHVSVRDHDWTYIENTETGANELYFRPDDPGQQADLTQDPTRSEQAIIDRFGPIAARHAESLTDGMTGESTGVVDAEIETRLDALGYR